MSRDLVATARGLVEAPDPSARFVWEAAATHLARQALEGALLSLWTRRGIVSLERASYRSQLIALPFYVERELACQVTWAWTALSEAGHEREAASRPTAADLRAWLDIVERFANAVEARSPMRPTDHSR